jgi:polyisoprenoid-binding protein YceI
MRLRLRCLLRGLKVAPALLALGGCPTRVPAPAAPPPSSAPAAHVGTPYRIASGESLLSIKVYKGGTLAAAGHNHLIASHDLSGVIYLSDEPLRTSFEVQLPLDSLTVDEAALRAAEHSSDFPPAVPDSAREGTRHNMLGPALLDSADYPQITLRALALEADAGAPGSVRAHVLVEVRGTTHEIVLPVSYERAPTTLTVNAESTLRQSELGLKPFSAMLGALQVQDEMRIGLHLVAHPQAAH